MRVFQGDADPARAQLEREWSVARAWCDAIGMKRVSRQLLPGVKHRSCAKEVMAFFAERL